MAEEQKKFPSLPKLDFTLWRAARAEEARKTAERRAAADAGIIEIARVGDTLPDGTIYAGISPDTGRKMFTLPSDAGIAMEFHEAAEYTLKLNKEKTLGHADWRLPTKTELNVLYQNRENGGLKDRFNLSASNEGWYWSSTFYDSFLVYVMAFRNGIKNVVRHPKNLSSVRCVR